MKSFTLPLPPATNNLFPTSKTGRRFKSAAYSSWIVDAGWRVREQGGKPLGCNSFEVDIVLPAKMRGDIDGRIKPLVDLLVAMFVVPDDRHMRKVTCQKGDVPEGMCRITVTPVSLPDFTPSHTPPPTKRAAVSAVPE